MLDSNDRDTDLLATGDEAIERFVVTYRLGGTVRTLEVDVAIKGVNESGQVTTDYNAPIDVAADTIIARDALIRFTNSDGFRQAVSTEPDPVWNFTNLGSISLAIDAGRSDSQAVSATPPLGRTDNFGRIAARSSTPETPGAASISAFGENHGVASAIYCGGYNSEFGTGLATGFAGVMVNSGLIETKSTFNAFGVYQPLGNNFTNTGFIYAEGGAGFTPAIGNDPLGIIGYRSGGAGNDALHRTAGNDIYILDNFDDLIVESIAGGVDGRLRARLHPHLFGFLRPCH